MNHLDEGLVQNTSIQSIVAYGSSKVIHVMFAPNDTSYMTVSEILQPLICEQPGSPGFRSVFRAASYPRNHSIQHLVHEAFRHRGQLRRKGFP